MQGNQRPVLQVRTRNWGRPSRAARFTYLSTESVFVVESATASAVVTVSSLAGVVEAVEDMTKRDVSRRDVENAAKMLQIACKL